MAASTGGASTSSPLSSVSDRLALDSDSDTSSSFVVSLLDRLKLPTAADIAQKRQTKTIDSPPLVGKRQCRGIAISDPKSIDPSKCVQGFPNELLKVSGGKLFCAACREELGLKRSTIHNHMRSR